MRSTGLQEWERPAVSGTLHDELRTPPMTLTDKGSQTLRSDTLLLLTASIWGFAFVAQRVGMDHVGPFGFNGVRFALGCLVLLPLLM